MGVVLHRSNILQNISIDLENQIPKYFAVSYLTDQIYIILIWKIRHQNISQHIIWSRKSNNHGNETDEYSSYYLKKH